jgi:hypothetical protein
MDYVYVGQFLIIDKIKFKKYILSNDNNENNEIIDELIKHIHIYKNMYNISNISNKLLLHDLDAVEIQEDINMCESIYTIENKSRILIYIIFLTKTKFIIQDNEIDIEKGNIVFFPSEWFFHFKLTKSKIIIGNVYEFKE